MATLLLAGCSSSSGDRAAPLAACIGNAAACEAETAFDQSKIQIRAGAAYERNLTGSDVTVGIVDSGLSAIAHPDLPRNRVTSLDDSYLAADEIDAESAHGTAVAGIIGASRDGIGTHGVAPGVTLVMQPAVFSGSMAGVDPGLDAGLTSALEAFPDSVSFVNISYARNEGIQRAEYTKDSLEADFSSLIPFVAQADVDADDRTVYVWAAGNRTVAGMRDVDAASPSQLSGLAAKVRQLLGHWLTVVSVYPPNTELGGNSVSGQLATSSYACGIAAAFCLAAPGVCVPTTAISNDAGEYFLSDAAECTALYSDSPLREGYAYVSGTSFAAPQVVGTLALMAQQFRGQMGNTALVSRLLQTADKTDYSGDDGADYSDDSLYGQGLLDVDAATAPVGQTSLISAAGWRRTLSTVQAQGARAQVAGLQAAQIYAALSASLSGREVMLLDDLDAPFWAEASATLMGWRDAIQARAVAAPVGAVVSRPIYLLGSSDRAHSPLLTLGGVRTLLAASSSHRVPLPAAVPTSPWMGLFDRSTLFGGVRAQLGGGGLMLGLAHRRGEGSGVQASAQGRSLMVAQYRLAMAGGEMSLLSGKLEEQGALQGLGSAALLATDLAATTRFIGVGGNWRLGRQWYLSADWQQAYSRMESGAAGPLRSLRGLRSSFAQMSFGRTALFGASDVLSISAVRSDPVAAGTAVWRLPTALDSGSVVYADYPSRLAGQSLYRMDIGYGNVFGRRLTIEGRLTSGETAGFRLAERQADAQWSLRLQLSF